MTTGEKRTTYRVEVHREGDAWVADVPDVPGAHTYARSVRALEGNIREVIALMTDTDDEQSFDVEVVLGGDEPAASAVAEARRLRAVAADAELKAKAAFEIALKSLKGLTGRDAGILIGMSHQRVHQVRKGSSKRGPRNVSS